jgi:hypothetical protein
LTGFLTLIVALQIPVIDAILEADKAAPAKQRHTAKRIFERLRDEHVTGPHGVIRLAC